MAMPHPDSLPILDEPPKSGRFVDHDDKPLTADDDDGRRLL
jgi:hypothetical protein